MYIDHGRFDLDQKQILQRLKNNPKGLKWLKIQFTQGYIKLVFG